MSERRSRHWVDYKYLLAWLQAATEGLSEDARARIREEITDHFHEALDGGLAAGLTEDAAARSAVEALGSPDVARRAFRRTYLSRWQGYLLRRFIEPPKFTAPSTSVILPVPRNSLWDPERERRMLPFFAALLTGMTALLVARFSPFSPLAVGLTAAMIAATIALAFVVPHLARRGRQRTAIALAAAAEVFMWTGFILAPYLSNPRLGLRIWIVTVFVAYQVIVYLPLLAKLTDHQSREA